MFELASTSLPLGVFSHITPDAGLIALEPGAVLVLVSRSVVVTETKGEEYGLGRVRESLKNTHLASAHDLCTVALEGVRGFTRKPQREAITALALIRKHFAG